MQEDDENRPPEPRPAAASRPRDSALQLGPRKKPCHSDPLIHHGRHFGRTVNALCNVFTLLTNGILRMVEQPDEPEESFTAEERREFRVFKTLLLVVPGIEKRIMTCSQEELRMIADLLQKGSSSARSDDTKSLKSAVIDWITPRGEPLIPPLPRNVKTCRGFNHEATGALLCPANLDWSDPEYASQIICIIILLTRLCRVKSKLRDGDYIIPGDQWPIMIYKDYKYDPEDPWNGLLRNRLLISVCPKTRTLVPSHSRAPTSLKISGIQTRIHLPKLRRKRTEGNTIWKRSHTWNDGCDHTIHRIHCYPGKLLIVRFALTSSAVFCRTDVTTDSQRFYDSVIEFLEDPMEQEEVSDLLTFWNRVIFPGHASAKRQVTRDSALARLKEKRAALRAANGVSSVSSR
ncbi:hypothetical protein Hypma_006362 [Hypsizygus marmoreus]|uniref:Uncharacterized protein n=1 Tax=Hypsizygus marmoreus TaxID=39966 RepID=A0A369K251_HYPMA|nr:hypothetical protein Hypma_006362 [Hypsizygus marmoreus]